MKFILKLKIIFVAISNIFVAIYSIIYNIFSHRAKLEKLRQCLEKCAKDIDVDIIYNDEKSKFQSFRMGKSLITINQKKYIDYQIFDLSHELGHAVLYDKCFNFKNSSFLELYENEVFAWEVAEVLLERYNFKLSDLFYYYKKHCLNSHIVERIEKLEKGKK